MNHLSGKAPLSREMRLQGLTTSEVEASRRQYGDNVLTPPARAPWWKIYLGKFDDPVIRILIIAALLAVGVGAVHGEYLEGIGILIAILLATTLAFANEYKAAREFDVLNRVDDEVPVQVIRNGAFTAVPRKDLVVGDLVLLEAGGAVPADGCVRESVALSVNEASLTGESLPAAKSAERDERTPSARDQTYPSNRLMRGTTVVDGHCVYQVTAVGNATEIGSVVRESQAETDEVTPLHEQLARLSKVIGVVGFAVAALTFGALVLRGAITGDLDLTVQQWTFAGLLLAGVLVGTAKVWLPILYDARELLKIETDPPEWLERGGLKGWIWPLTFGVIVVVAGGWAGRRLGWIPGSTAELLPAAAGEALLSYFMIAVTIIVVAVPEGLAMSVTLSLAYSMRKMTAANTLVRRMHACETIGAATVICSDKTGTLTRNDMRVEAVRFPGIPGGDLGRSLGSLGARLVIEAIAANSTANLGGAAGQEVESLGNPTEGALLRFLAGAGIDYGVHRDGFRIGARLTFSTERKYMATIGDSAAVSGRLLHVKGAPEVLLSRCNRILTPGGIEPLDRHRPEIAGELHDLQGRGMRTLGFAYLELSGDEGREIEEMAYEMIWLGFAALADPVRDEVPQAIRDCRRAGIEVKIITGDNAATAREIGRQIGLLEVREAPSAQMEGVDFAGLSDSEALKVAEGLRVLSRARPMDKMRLVKLLQEKGHVVAVTGDGTNDAPALHHANVGLSMGRTGTSIAKEASDIVLLDDSFHSIVKAVSWGRSLYLNIQRFVLFQLTINVAALGISLLGPFLGTQIPLTVVQMLWVNLIMDTFAALALATEPPDSGAMRRPPRDPRDFIVTPAMAKTLFGMGSLFVALLAAVLLHFEAGGVSPYEQSVFFSIFVMLQFWNLGNARRLGSSLSAFHGLKENKLFLWIALTILVGQFTIVQLGGEVFRTVPLPPVDWLWIIAGTSFVLWVGEAWRLVQRLRERAGSPELARSN